MFLSEPGQTNYDIRFNLLGFPVRVHPMFFLIGVFLGASSFRDGTATLIFVGILFLSVLIHELGHAFAFRQFRIPCRIVLYMMGGLAIPGDNNPWSSGANYSLSPKQQIWVSFAGPLAGFLLAGFLIAICIALQAKVIPYFSNYIPGVAVDFEDSLIAGNRYLPLLLQMGIWINIYLNLLNLLPVYPLDGGQIARQLFIQSDSQNGVRNSIILSIVTAGLIALLSFSAGSTFIGFFFGFMAWQNYMSLKQFGGGGYGGGGYGGGRPW